MKTSPMLPLLVNARDVATLLGISRSQVFELRKAGYLPLPVELDGSVRWRVRELEDWLLAGCPMRDDWQWKPTLVVKLPQLLDMLHAEIAELQSQVRDAESRLGSDTATIRSK